MHVLSRLTVRALLGHWSSLLAALATGIALLVLALSTWSIRALDTSLDAVGEEVRITAFLNPTLDEAGTEAVLRALAARPEVSFVAYRSPSTQRAKLAGILGEALVEAIEPQMLPFGAAVEVGVALGAVTTEAVASLEGALNALEAIDGVDAIPWRPTSIEAIAELRAMGSLSAHGIAVLLALLAVGAAAGWASLARRRDMALYALLERFGATSAQIHQPLAIAASIVGILAGTVALIAFHVITAGFEPALMLLPGASVPSTALTWLFFLIGGPSLALGGIWLGGRDREPGGWSDG